MRDGILLTETVILGVIITVIFLSMILRDKGLANRSWWLGVMVIAVILYVMAVFITASIRYG